MEVDKRMAPISKHNTPKKQSFDDAATVPRSIRDKSLPPDPPVSTVTTPRRPSVDVGPGSGPIFIPADTMQGVRRRVTEPISRPQYDSDDEFKPPVRRGLTFADPEHNHHEHPREYRRRMERAESDNSSDSSHHHHISNMIFKRPEDMVPGDGLYKKPVWLNEWRNATVGTLSGNLLELSDDDDPTTEGNKAWWEEGGHRRNSSYGSRPRKAEAFDGEYDETNGTMTLHISEICV